MPTRDSGVNSASFACVVAHQGKAKYGKVVGSYRRKVWGLKFQPPDYCLREAATFTSHWWSMQGCRQAAVHGPPTQVDPRRHSGQSGQCSSANDEHRLATASVG